MTRAAMLYGVWTVAHLVITVLGCGAPRPPAESLPQPRTPREILDALPMPPPAGDPWATLRRAPEVAIPTVTPLAGRPFWPLDRVDGAVRPYLEDPAVSGTPDRAAYSDAWSHHARGDSDRAMAELSSLATSATEPALRIAAHRDTIQLRAAAYDADTAVAWFSAAEDRQRLAAELARLGKPEEARLLLAALPRGDDVQGCELRLNLARVDPAGQIGEMMQLWRALARPHLRACFEATSAWLCAELLPAAATTAFVCKVSGDPELRRAWELARVLEDWGQGPDRAPRWRPPARFWIMLAERAGTVAPLVGWERVARDALHNALVTGRCEARTLEAVRRATTQLQVPTDPDLRGYATITEEQCRAWKPRP